MEVPSLIHYAQKKKTIGDEVLSPPSSAEVKHDLKKFGIAGYLDTLITHAITFLIVNAGTKFFLLLTPAGIEDSVFLEADFWGTMYPIVWMLTSFCYLYLATNFSGQTLGMRTQKIKWNPNSDSLNTVSHYFGGALWLSSWGLLGLTATFCKWWASASDWTFYRHDDLYWEMMQLQDEAAPTLINQTEKESHLKIAA